MIYGFELTDSGNEQVKSFNDNLNNPNKVLSSRLFVGEIRNIKDNLYVCTLDYVFPMPTILFVLSLCCALIFNIVWLGMLSLGFLVLIVLLNSKYFYFVMMIWGFKRMKYKGKVKLLSTQETITRIIN